MNKIKHRKNIKVIKFFFYFLSCKTSSRKPNSHKTFHHLLCVWSLPCSTAERVSPHPRLYMNNMFLFQVFQWLGKKYFSSTPIFGLAPCLCMCKMLLSRSLCKELIHFLFVDEKKFFQRFKYIISFFQYESCMLLSRIPPHLTNNSWDLLIPLFM